MNEDVFDAKPSNQSKAVAVFDPVKKLIADLEISVRDLVFDVQTESGHKECAELVARINKLRTRSDALRKEHTEPHLKAQRALMAVFRDHIEAKCNALVAPFQKLLDDEQERRDTLAREAEEREASRIRVHRDRIVAVRNLTSLALGKSSMEVRQLLAAIPPAEVIASMQEFVGEMEEAVAHVTPLLNAAVLMAEEREDNKRREAELQAQLAEARAAQPVALPGAACGVIAPTGASANTQAAGVIGAGDARQRRLDAMGLSHQGQQAAHQAEMRRVMYGSPQQSERPSDDDIIDTLSLKYRVHESKVIEWLLAMDLQAASRRLMNQF